MSHTVVDFKTKNDLIKAVEMGPVEVRMDGFGRNTNGNYWFNGPHNTTPSLWIAHAQVQNGQIIQVLR